MGNSGSHPNQVSQREIPEEQWAHSFPRTQTTKFGYQHKVLPDRDGDLKLKSTNNGDILHSGGTLTGKPKSLDDKKNEYSSHGFREHSPAARKYFPKEKETQYKSRAQGVQHKLNQNASSQKNNLNGQMKLCVSEPDLRYSSDSNLHMKEKRCKKKYKAPPPPQLTDRPYLDWNGTSNPHIMPIRKARLFKTRAEMKKQSSQTNENVENSDIPIDIPLNGLRTSKSNRLSLPEIKLDFFEELKTVTTRLRHVETKASPTKEKLIEKIDDSKNRMANCVRGEASGKESTTPEMSPELKKKADYPREKPKTFYFGMNEEPVPDTKYHDDIFNAFSNSFHQNTKLPMSSASDISSDIHSDENDMYKSGLDLQLRPILPKKQLEIPKFSPAAAWRLLSMDASERTGGTVVSDDVSILLEERIEKFARPPPPMIHAGHRSSNDKSGDSGISGDDPIPNGAYDDNNEGGILQEQQVKFTMSHYINPQERSSWTPQQDLGDDSSIEECKNEKSSAPNPRIRSGPHIFSLSLPRDNQLAAYMIERSSLQYSGLQKLKKSLSGVLGNLSSKKDVVEAEFNDEVSANWFLSKSAPNSLNNAFHSLEMRKANDQEQLQLLNVNKQARMMYLPEIELNRANRRMEDVWSSRSHYSLGHSQSCEDLSVGVKRAPEPLQDSAKEEYSWKLGTRKPKKFTFQSTIRQIEKRRLSDKLSREAERREQKRIQELEAMEKVEEEFQRKRAREKADIRQQLRLICMEKNPAWSSLPPNLEVNAQVRPEPDGAFSSTSSASPPPKTKTSSRPFQKFKSSNNSRTGNNMKIRATPDHSELTSVPREYMDYRGVKYTNDGGLYRHTTVHPEVTCNMPKVKDTKLVQSNNNYRRDMAAGVRSTLTVGSTDSENSHNYRSVDTKHSSPLPMSYFHEDQLHC
ncbi:unnamed protein product [Phaedon cochleariae]|uniref:Uncharacterized protein n=1 Tax=Phaedon cochleariae TaxID=80249 RepID=A0A9P0DK40_PHACE|nr:unnamed protein product [Phaedon cochleariae]